MSESENREDRMARMLQDALTVDSPDPELLARYVEDRGSLSAEERREVEVYFDASPAQREQLRVLASFDLAGVLAEAKADAITEPRVSAAPGAWARFRERFRDRSGWVWAPAAVAAAAVVFLLVRMPGPGSVLPGTSEPVEVAAKTPPELPLGDSLPSEQLGVEGSSPAVERISPEAVQLAERVVPEKPVLEAGEERVAQAPAWDPLEGSPPPAGARVMPDPEAEKEAIQLLAMVDPVYSAPPGASPHPLFATFRSAPTVGGGSPVLVAPDHVGRSASPEPALLWKLAARPAPGATLSLVVAPLEGRDALVDQPLALPASTGLVRTELGDLGAVLEGGITYSWMVILAPDPDEPSQEVVATGLVEFVPPVPSLVERIGASGPGQRPAEWAATGYWYDAAAELDALARQYPENVEVKRALRSLLLQSEGRGAASQGTP